MQFHHNFVPDLKLRHITNEDGKRVYVCPNGLMANNTYESVTTFISRNFDKPWLEPWKKKLGEKKANNIKLAAQKRGKSLHTAAENYLLNTPLDLNDSPSTKSLFVMIRPLLDRVNNIRLIEKPIYSDELRLAGTPDIVADFDGVLSVCDVKSNNFANKKRIDLIDYMLQTACYAVMFKERFNIMPQQSVVIVASPNSAVGMLKVEPMGQCVEMLYGFIRDPVAFCGQIAATRLLLAPKTAPRASNAVENVE